jgi:hypothetical protein
MADLQAVFLGIGREFGTAEHRGDVDLVEDVGDLGLIERAFLLDGMLEEQTGRIAAGRVVTRLDCVFGLESLRELRGGWTEVGLERGLRLPLRWD